MSDTLQLEDDLELENYTVDELDLNEICMQETNINLNNLTSLTQEQIDRLYLSNYYYAYGFDDYCLPDAVYETYMNVLRKYQPEHPLLHIHYSQQGIPYDLLVKYNMPMVSANVDEQQIEKELPEFVAKLRTEYLEHYRNRYSDTLQKSIELIQDDYTLNKRMYELNLVGKRCHLSIKADGQNFTAVYFKGHLVFAESKGRSGNPFEITLVMRNVLPNTIKTDEQVVMISGENLCFKQSLGYLKAKYTQRFKTTRSAVSSLLRGGLEMEDIKTHLKPLVFKVRSENLHTLSEEFAWARTHGFNVPVYESFILESNEHLYSMIRKYEPLREALDYSNDGLVLAIDDNEDFYSQGSNWHHYNGNLAIKVGVWQPSVHVGYVTAIEWIAGNFLFTPVAVIEPVELASGVEVTHVPLNNCATIEKHNITIGSEIYFMFTSDSKITLINE